MEPEILATTGDAPTRPADWIAATAAAKTEAPSSESDSLAEPRNGRIFHANGHPTGWSRSATTHHGHTNGHARLRTAAVHGARASSQAPALTLTVPQSAPFETPRPSGFYLRQGKRLLDIVGAAVALVIGLPLLAILAALILIESRGPVLYRSVRIGRGGRPFVFYKLRSMVKDADRRRDQLSHLNEADGPVFKIARDPRITRIGRFIRTTSLDEIPQFWNVLKGDMSLVGPRPPIPEEVAQYEPWQLRRLDVRPGITCLWQISGRSRLGFEEWMRLDLQYIKRQSFLLDLRILVRTIPAVLSREGAY